MKTTQDPTILQLPASLRSERLLVRLTSRVPARVHVPRSEEFEFYDSFDRDLWFAQLAFYRRGDQLAVQPHGELLTRPPRASSACCGDPPRLWWDLPPSPLTEVLARHLKLRAVEPLLRVTATCRSVDVMNEDGKTVVRLYLHAYASPQDEHGSVLELCLVQPLRGYEGDFARVCAELLQLGLYAIESAPVARMIAEVVGIPDRYPGERALELDAWQPSRQAVCEMMRDFWSFAQSRQAGIINDTDTEFLHQYRVALRKIRSLLGQLKDVLPEPQTEALKRDFGQLARSTNRLRDLDVYLLSQARYGQLLPPTLREGLQRMFQDFQKQRESALSELRDQLRSESHRETVQRLDHLLQTADRLPATANAPVPILKLATQNIGKRYRKIAARGGKIDQATPAAALHALRIDAKKLRYLLEFFGSLYDLDEMAAIVRRLKKLQDGLGVFNDLCVQQDSLAEYLRTRCQGSGFDAPLTASIGGLIGALHQCQLEQRRKAVAGIADFCHPDVGRMFDRLSQPSKKVA